MGFSYKPLFRLLVDRNMKKTDLHTEVGLSSATLAKLSKGNPLSGESMEKLCIYFKCQPNDVVEIIWPDESAPAEETAKPVKASQRKERKRSAASKAPRRRADTGRTKAAGTKKPRN